MSRKLNSIVDDSHPLHYVNLLPCSMKLLEQIYAHVLPRNVCFKCALNLCLN